MRGMIHVYTGDGKGKTTAAFGLAARAVGHGKRVLFAQFLKGGREDSGELRMGKLSPLHMTVLRFHQVHPRFDPTVKPDELAVQVQKDFEDLKQTILREEYDLVVLDEVDNCVCQGLLPIESLLSLLEEKPVALELVLTGRGADPRVIEKADYVTEMRKIKHPAETSGVPAREGIEY
jgi:cob(I)alamin adenosyltransferase